jgi:hypothetical protein
MLCRYFVGGIAFVDEVPKLASGKIIRKLMREWAKVSKLTYYSWVEVRILIHSLKKAVPEMEGKIKARL